MYSIIPEAWNIQACNFVNVLQVQWHTRGDAADMEDYSSLESVLEDCIMFTCMTAIDRQAYSMSNL